MACDGRYNSTIQQLFAQQNYDLCQKFINLEGQTDFTIQIQSKIYRIQGKTTEALKLLEDHAKISNSFTSETTFLDIAKTLISVNKIKRANKILTKLYKNNQNNDEILYYLALCFKKIDVKHDKIEALLKKAVEINPKNSLAYAELANFYKSQSKAGKNLLSQTVGIYKTGFENCPENLSLGTNYGLALCEIGNFLLAEQILVPLIKSDPENLRATLAAGVCGQLNFFKALKEQGQQNNTRIMQEKLSNNNLNKTPFWNCYQEIYKYAPETPALWNNLGLVFIEKDIYASLFCLKRANYLSPLNISCLYNLGLIYFKLKHYVHACNMFQAARQIQEANQIPKSDKLATHCLLMLALSLYKVHDIKNSKRAFNEALKYCNKDPWIYTNYALYEYHNRDNMNLPISSNCFKIISEYFGDKSIDGDERYQIECLSRLAESLLNS